MVTDTSGSMLAKDVQPDRLTAAKEAGHALADKLPRDFRLGLIGFGTSASQLVEPTTDKARVKAGDRLADSSRGKTAMGDGLALGDRRRAHAGDRSGHRRCRSGCRPRSCCSPTAPTPSAQDPITRRRARPQVKIPVYTVALGTPSGTLEHTRRDGTTSTRTPVPPDTDDAAGDRARRRAGASSRRPTPSG